MSVNEAIALLKANGYRVVKPKAKPDPLTFAASCERRGLNAIGKQYSPQFDPNYRRRTSLTSIARLLKPMPASTKWMEVTS